MLFDLSGKVALVAGGAGYLGQAICLALAEQGATVMVADLARERAKAIAADMLDIILPDLPFAAGDEVVVLVSGLGATPVMELYIFYAEVAAILEKNGIKVHRTYVGNYFTSLEMMGVTLTVMKLDEELKTLVDVEAESMGLTQF